MVKDKSKGKAAAAETEAAESTTRVGALHQAHADYIAREKGITVTPEQVFAVYSTRVAFRKSDDYRVGVREAKAAEKAAQQEAKDKAKADREAERAAKAEEKAKAKAEKEAAAAAAKEAETPATEAAPAKGKATKKAAAGKGKGKAKTESPF